MQDTGHTKLEIGDKGADVIAESEDYKDVTFLLTLELQSEGIPHDIITIVVAWLPKEPLQRLHSIKCGKND